jgi:hypothetical protein
MHILYMTAEAVILCSVDNKAEGTVITMYC